MKDDDDLPGTRPEGRPEDDPATVYAILSVIADVAWMHSERARRYAQLTVISAVAAILAALAAVLIVTR